MWSFWQVYSIKSETPIAVMSTANFGLRFINLHTAIFSLLGAFLIYPRPNRAFLPNAVPSRRTRRHGNLESAICAVVASLIEKLAYVRCCRSPKLAVLITAIGVSLLIEYTCQNDHIFGAAPKSFPAIFPAHHITQLGSLSLNSNQIVVFAVTLILLLALRFIVLKTKIGTAMRALSFNPEAAALMGINTDVVISFTFGLGSALAAAAGILFAVNYPSIDPLMGILPGLKAFVAGGARRHRQSARRGAWRHHHRRHRNARRRLRLLDLPRRNSRSAF